MSLPVPISLLHSARALSPGESVQGGVGPAPCPSRGWPREWAELGQPMAKARALAGEAPSGRSHRMHGLGQEWGLELDLHRVPLSVREVAGPRLWRQLGFLGELTWQMLSP